MATKKKPTPAKATTTIPWTHHTFNPWWGCTRVSPGCQHCYAEAFAKRVGKQVWGVTAPRRFFGEKHWNDPVRWNAAAVAAGERRRVFCASMADVFEGGRPDLAEPRRRLWRLIAATPGLDWLVLTKRPQNILATLREDLEAVAHAGSFDVEGDGPEWLAAWLKGTPPANVWVGTTVEDQARARERVDHLVAVPAVVRFLSMEPLLEAVTVRAWLGAPPISGPGSDRAWTEAPGVDWVIVGGESGPGARPFNVEWARAIRDEVQPAGARFFMKQIGARPFSSTGILNIEKSGTMKGGRFSLRIVEMESTATWRPTDAKGESLEDLPEDLRIRDFPEVTRAR